MTATHQEYRSDIPYGVTGISRCYFRMCGAIGHRSRQKRSSYYACSLGSICSSKLVSSFLGVRSCRSPLSKYLYMLPQCGRAGCLPSGRPAVYLWQTISLR